MIELRQRLNSSFHTFEPTHTHYWNDLLLSFGGHCPELKEVDGSELSYPDFDLENYKGWVVGLRVGLRDGGGRYLSASEMLERTLPDLASRYVAPELLTPHPDIHQIPQGVMGADSVWVRRISALSSLRERPEAAARLLEQLGFSAGCGIIISTF